MSDFLTDQLPRLMPIPVVLFLVLFFGVYWVAQMPAKGTAEWVEFARGKGKTSDFRRHPLKRPDWIAMAAVTLVYAAVTFFYLGNTDSPVSFYRFEHSEHPLVITLDKPEELSRLQYFGGINYDNHKGRVLRLEVSADGEAWEQLADIPRDTGATFRWQETTGVGGFGPIKALRLYTDNSGMDLGEIALRDPYGNLIDASRLTVTRAGEPDPTTPEKGRNTQDPNAIFDEQHIVPVRRSILNSTHFDEIYHAYTAYEFLEGRYPYENTHPPLGKLTTALGIKLFGMTPFGWRFMPALFGVLMLPFLFALIHNMFGKTLISLCGTTIFAFDFMHYVQTRISTIDVYAVFYIILMYLFMYRWMTRAEEKNFSRTVPDLALCGLAFGLGAASKWVCIYAALGLIVLYVWGLARRYGVHSRGKTPFGGFFWQTIAVSLLFFVIIPGILYVASYAPYVTNGPATPSAVWSACWSNQKTMLGYHSKLEQQDITAPANGVVSNILFNRGQSVKRGETYLVFTDSQGDTHELTAEKDCKLLRVMKGKGKAVREGETMVILYTGGHSFESKWHQWLFDIRPVYFYAGDYTEEIPVTAPADGVLRWAARSEETTSRFAYAKGDVLLFLDTPDGQTVEVAAGRDADVLRVTAEAGASVKAGDTLLYLSGTYMRASVSTFNNPVISWGGLAALLAAFMMLILRGKKIALFIVIGYLSQLVPWMMIERTTYAYHYFPSVIFLVLALCFVFDTHIERVSMPPSAPAKLSGKKAKNAPVSAPPQIVRRLPSPRVMMIAFTAVTVALFAMFYPVLSGYPVPQTYVKYFLKWLTSWPV